LLVRAEQDLAATANGLSFYLRDAAGDPVTPGNDRLPAAFPELRLPPLGPDLARRIERPDLAALLVRLDQAQARRRGAENDLLPRLDVLAEAAKDIGPVGLGGSSRTPAEAIVGLRFSLPLERRQARGRIAEANAEAEGLRARRKLIEDQILVEVNGLAIQVRAAEQLVALAGDETQLANRMAEAERRRFQLGASDFIVVNLREESAADARLRQLDAEYRRSSARAELVAATVDREQLGLR
jgi:outer membrane protein TolC